MVAASASIWFELAVLITVAVGSILAGILGIVPGVRALFQRALTTNPEQRTTQGYLALHLLAPALNALGTLLTLLVVPILLFLLLPPVFIALAVVLFIFRHAVLRWSKRGVSFWLVGTVVARVASNLLAMLLFGIASTNTLNGSGFLALFSLTLPAAILLLPAYGAGTHLHHSTYRAINRTLTLAGALRWLAAAVAAVTFYGVYTNTPLFASDLAVLIGFVAGITHVGIAATTALYANQTLQSGALALHRATPSSTNPPPPRRPAVATPRYNRHQRTAPPPPTPTSPVAGAQAARAAASSGLQSNTQVINNAPQPAASAQQPVPTGTPTGNLVYCPVCQTAADLSDEECPSCGLLFASRIPAQLRTLPDYTIVRPLGDGGMSSVYLARTRFRDELVVLKTLVGVEQQDSTWRSEATRCLRREATLLQQLDHPHIARMRSWYSGAQVDVLVLDYVPGATLAQHLTRDDGSGTRVPGTPLPRLQALQHGITVTTILDHLAHLPQPVIHHDIKPANLIVHADTERLMLVDFGSAVLPHSGSSTVRFDSYGTPGYAAPEQYQGMSSPASDVYGLAATLYHLLTDDDPTAHPLQFPQMHTLPTRLAATLTAALDNDPARRPSARRFRSDLEALLRAEKIAQAA